jgi:hypothetical protein
MHWDNFSEEFVHPSNMSLSSVTLGAGNEFPGVALVTGAAGSGMLRSSLKIVGRPDGAPLCHAFGG